MPIYGYRCQSCAREFEVVQRMSDPAKADCPDCGGAGTRQFFPAGIVFKGSGFYKTDSRSSTPASAPASDAAKPSEAGKAADGATPPVTSPEKAPAPSPSSGSKPAAPTTKPGPSSSASSPSV